MGKKAVHSLNVSIVYFLISFLCGLCVIGSLASYCEPENFKLISSLGVILPVLILMVVIIGVIVLLFSKHKMILIPVLIAIVSNYSYLSSIFQIHFNKEESHKDAIVVASYNVHAFNEDITGYYVRNICKMMVEHNVDVVCMQECYSGTPFNNDSIRRAFRSNFPYCVFPKTKQGSDVSIFSRYPILSRRVYRFKPKLNPFAIVVDIAQGHKIVRVITTHLYSTSYYQDLQRTGNDKKSLTSNEVIYQIGDHMIETSIKRNQQVKYLLRIAKRSPHPVILCGDCNVTPSSRTYALLREQLTDGFKESGHGYIYTFRPFMKLLRIDYVMHTPNLQCTDYRTLKVKWSDHLPTIATMEYK